MANRRRAGTLQTNLFKHSPGSGINKVMKRKLAIALAGLVIGLPQLAQAAHTRVSLLLADRMAKPGDTVQAAVRLQMDAGWHTYWRNGGDSGGPTTIAWELPPGLTAGEIEWPVPEKLNTEGLITFIYHDEAWLLVPLRVAPDAKPGPVEVKAKVGWLECDQICVPGDDTVSAQLVVGDTTTPSAEAALIQAARSRLPAASGPLNIRATWEKPAGDKTRTLLLEWEAPDQFDAADFYPYASEAFEVSPTTESVAAANSQARVRLTVKTFEAGWPKEIQGLLINRHGAEVRAMAATIPVLDMAVAARASAKAAPQSLGWMLLYAFLGGLILNIMPCVLPVIALKILGFVNQAKESPARVRALGLVYAGGVLVSFLVLAGVVIGLKAAGQAAGWGMQFSSPRFTIAFCVLVTLVALNLFGVFEVTLGGGVMNAAGELAARHGASGAFFNGVLATILATPCTAPFLSVALGFAFAQSAAIILLVFLTVGAGLASPYVLLSWFPGWLKWLPKPGVWMERFKVAMGFPMLATALWLASLVSDRYGERAWWLGIFLVFIGIAAWIFGEFIQRGQRHKGLATAFLLGVLALAYFGILNGRLQWRHPLDPVTANAGTLKHSPQGYPWETWSAEAVNRARAAGRSVLIDFTAKWCITCNSIVKPALSRPVVVEQLTQGNVAAFVADYTNYGTNILAEMQRYDRAAVPLVLVFPSKAEAPPIILPDPNPLLGPGHYADLVVEALRSAGK